MVGGLVENQQLDMPDPIFGLPFRRLMLTLGATELLAAFLCLFTGKKTLSLGLVIWLSINFMVYRIALWNMGWHRSCGLLIDPLRLSLATTDLIFSLSSTFLLVGSITALWLEHRKLQASESLKISCHSCGGHIKFAIQNLGQKIPCPHCQTTITLRKPENLKMACFFCKKRIEFPAHALHQKISCPHCKMDITLKESA